MSDIYLRSVILGSTAPGGLDSFTNARHSGIGVPGDSFTRHSEGSLQLLTGRDVDVRVTPGFLIALSGRARIADTESFLDAAAVAPHWKSDAEGLLARLHGDFALIIYDSEQGIATLATDRFCQLPVCYAEAADGSLAFSSDARLLAGLPGVDSELSPQALYHYLFFHTIPTPDSVFSGVRRLEPAHVLTHGPGGGTSVRSYWSPEFVEQPPAEIRALQKDFRRLLERSVRIGLDDRKTGTFLSGGLDSSTVTGILAKAMPGARAYSIGFEAQGYDEMEFARTACEHFSVDHREYYVTPKDVHAGMGLLASAYDEPFGNSSAIPAYYCAKIAAEDGVELMLAGDGGDELFAGNVRYTDQQLLGLYDRLPEFLRRAFIESWLFRMPRGIPLLSKLQSYVQQARAPMPDRLERWNYFTRNSPNEMLTRSFVDRLELDRPLSMLRAVYARSSGASLVNRMLHLDWKQTLADNDLRKVNRMSKLAGIDVAYPFLDAAVLDFSTRIPTRLKIRRRNLRAFYKDAVRDFLPDKILRKSKHGFGLPFGVWLRTDPNLRELSFDSLASLRGRGIVSGAYLDSLRDSHDAGHAAYYGEFIWVLTMLELWLQQNAPRYVLT